MAANDYAVVVGIDRYPWIGNLKGAENDARAVVEWLEDPAGGDVPEGHIQAICSSDYDGQDEAQLYRPTPADVYRPFERLLERSREREDGRTEDGRPLGRRLYIFMAGHGVSAEPIETTLLTANASSESMGHGVCGTTVAGHFVKKGLFEEVVLLMDCCRNDLAFQQTLPWRYIEGVTSTTTFVYGFATADRDHGAREQEVDGVVRGVFTVALLRALRSGSQSSKTIEDVVAAGMREILELQEAQSPYFIPGPRVVHFGTPASPLLLAIACQEHERGETSPATIAIGRGDGTPALRSRAIRPGECWEVELDQGLYEIVRDRPPMSTIVKLAVKGHHVEI
jgi:uncharacterized caspase-like protein